MTAEGLREDAAVQPSGFVPPRPLTIAKSQIGLDRATPPRGAVLLRGGRPHREAARLGMSAEGRDVRGGRRDRRADAEPWGEYAQALLGTSELQYFR